MFFIKESFFGQNKPRFIQCHVYCNFNFQDCGNLPPPNYRIFIQFCALVADVLYCFCHKVSFVTTVCLSNYRKFFFTNRANIFYAFYLTLNYGGGSTNKILTLWGGSTNKKLILWGWSTNKISKLQIFSPFLVI